LRGLAPPGVAKQTPKERPWRSLLHRSCLALMSSLEGGQAPLCVSCETWLEYDDRVPRETVMMIDPAVNRQELDRVGEWLGIIWSEEQRMLLQRYQHWLLEEALPAGGIGPGEAPRVFDRHIADSLAFLPLIDASVATLVDVGSGVGLPGIPIAIALPGIAVTILDRSERRMRLAGRAVRILGLENVEPRTIDVNAVRDVFDVTTFRAALRIDEATRAFQRLSTDQGTGLFAWSRSERPKSPPQPPSDTIFGLVSEGSGVLESPAWFLRMQRSQPT
jgi:16S rRNA G527 N7-methylase RsmG